MGGVTKELAQGVTLTGVGNFRYDVGFFGVVVENGQEWLWAA